MNLTYRFPAFTAVAYRRTTNGCCFWLRNVPYGVLLVGLTRSVNGRRRCAEPRVPRVAIFDVAAPPAGTTRLVLGRTPHPMDTAVGTPLVVAAVSDSSVAVQTALHAVRVERVTSPRRRSAAPRRSLTVVAKLTTPRGE